MQHALSLLVIGALSWTNGEDRLKKECAGSIVTRLQELLSN